MDDLDGLTVYSATDLVGYLACEHLTTLDRATLAGMLTAEERVDEELQVLRDRGEEHELRFLEHLKSRGWEVRNGRHPKVEGDSRSRRERLEADAELTKQLMRDGVDVIFQAALFDGRWRGYADFLLRKTGPSDLGAHHYEVADTKLARRTKGGALLQMCVYSELVAGIQGRMPAEMHVALGGSGNRIDTHRLDDYLAYFHSVKDRFEAAVAPDQPLPYPLTLPPEPVAHCEVCRWAPVCTTLRKDADHLSLVAGLRSDQARRLRLAGVETRTALGELREPLPEIADMAATTVSGLHQQARLQLAAEHVDPPPYEFLGVEPDRGLAALPPPSWGDLFFDIEGDPFAELDGLEYLFGVWDPHAAAGGAPPFHAWWAHSRAEEKVAFEGFVDFVMARWRTDPDMHVYHYAAYERGRMGMLSTRHATREAEVDQMLRSELFVDLYKVVRQGLRIGVDSYSIKKLEPLYALHRDAPLKDAGSSVVAYEKYIRSVSVGSPDAAILEGIRLYNEDDCRSNLALRDWLEARRREHAERTGAPVPRLGEAEGEEKKESRPSERDERIARLVERLLEDVPDDIDVRAAEPATRVKWLLAHLLEWHRREEKVEWWAFYDRCGRSDEELATADEEAIGQLTWIAEAEQVKQSVVHRYRFDPEQTYRLKVGDKPFNPRTGREAGEIVALDALAGTLDLKWGRRNPRPHPTSLIPPKPFTADAQKAALERLGDWVVEHGTDGAAPWTAALDFLRGAPPRAGQAPGDRIVPEDVAVAEPALRAVLALDESVLPVQGPPGSGKTFLGAEMILALLREGRRVGITAFTHRALTNLLDEVLEHAAARGEVVRAVRKRESKETVQETWLYDSCTDNDEVAFGLANGTYQLAAGTGFMWARPEFTQGVDTLFVDEAGQMSLANVMAVAGAARNIVLLGDPQQLSQVRKGAHPDGVDVSSLEHVLGGTAVIDPTRGIFLPVTYRLHPDVNVFTSEIFYARQLQSGPDAGRQSIHTAGWLSGTGLRWRPVVHAGNRNSSDEEADAVADAYRELLGGMWTDDRGQQHPIGPSQVLVVAPYNAHVELLTERLQAIARSDGTPGQLEIGTVDKIQGQQAAAVIYSLATSSQEEMPRTMEFLFSLNRLNVATSRGRCVAVVIGSPDLLRVRAHTPEQMRLANALCRFVELARDQAVVR